MKNFHEPSRISPQVTHASHGPQHGLQQLVNSLVGYLRDGDTGTHGGQRVFNRLCVRCGKTIWIGIMLFLPLISWIGVGAQPTDSATQGPTSQTKALEVEALRLNKRVGQLVREGRIADAIPLARRSLDLSEQVHGKVHRNVSADLVTLANLYLSQEDYFNAEPLITRAINIDKQIFGPRHPEVAIDIASLGNIFSKKGDKQAAVKSYQEALELMYASPDAGSYLKKTAEIHSLFAKTLLELNQTNDAIAQYLAAEQIYELIDQRLAVHTLIEMAEADRARGNQPRAKVWLDRARQLEGR